jgi:hypothetical protein
MKKRDLLELAKNPNFISGIYNYCDRWCERCAFTSRCMVFAMEQADHLLPGERDVRNKEFWKKLEANLKLTRKMVHEMAKERGIELDPKALAALGRDEGRKEPQARKHPLAKAAFDYTRHVDRWFKEEKMLLFEKEEEIKTKARLGVPGVKEEVASLTDVVEIIRWYQHQIYVKLMRALSPDVELETELAGFPKDADGSAKVALIGIDRSIAAWAQMREHFPERTDDLLNFLVHLDRLRRATEKEFPAARSFVRPGFDAPSAS